MGTSRTRGTPRWEDTMLAALDAKPPRKLARSIGLNLPTEWMGLVLKASRQRKMSVASYARRAVMAFVLQDLGLDWEETMRDEPRTRSEYLSGDDPEGHEGYGFGPWKIEGLGTYVRRG